MNGMLILLINSITTGMDSSAPVDFESILTINQALGPSDLGGLFSAFNSEVLTDVAAVDDRTTATSSCLFELNESIRNPTRRELTLSDSSCSSDGPNKFSSAQLQALKFTGPLEFDEGDGGGGEAEVEGDSVSPGSVQPATGSGEQLENPNQSVPYSDPNPIPSNNIVDYQYEKDNTPCLERIHSDRQITVCDSGNLRELIKVGPLKDWKLLRIKRPVIGK